jgi:hypothetical protein
MGMPDQELIDAANHMRDCVNMHVAARLASGADKPQFVAIRLDTGKSPDNHTLYDERKDVYRYNTARNILAVKVGVETMPLREAIIVLQQHRQAYSTGHVFSDEAPITPHLTELLAPFIPNTLRKLN